MLKISGIKRIICCFLILTLCCLMLTGCDMTRGLREHYTKEEAEKELKTGEEKMAEWIRVNCPGGKATSMENSFWQLTGGPIFLSGFVEGKFSDGKKSYSYLMNVKTGELYLDPGKNKRQEFYDECLSLVKESLGVNELIMDKDEYSNMSFVLSMGIEDRFMVNGTDKKEGGKNDDLKENAMGSWVSKLETTGYLPASLVLSDGQVRDYVRDRARKDLIIVGMNVYVTEGTDLSRYTVKNVEKLEKEYGLYFERLILQTDKESLDLNQHGGERNASISKK
ncbi:MAG: hypothetical protein IK152_01690 [Lachnospiraceae bacterium]|nr:hypothetical protein [Lachnospiraceae bacterium]